MYVEHRTVCRSRTFTSKCENSAIIHRTHTPTQANRVCILFYRRQEQRKCNFLFSVNIFNNYIRYYGRSYMRKRIDIYNQSAVKLLVVLSEVFFALFLLCFRSFFFYICVCNDGTQTPTNAIGMTVDPTLTHCTGQKRCDKSSDDSDVTARCQVTTHFCHLTDY